MKDLEKMMMKKDDKKSDMSPQQIQAKMDVLKELMDLAGKEMGSRVKSGMDEMNKVTVAAADGEGLKEGLKVAESILPIEGNNDSPIVEDLGPDDETIVSEPEELEVTESIQPEADDEDDDIFAKKRKKSKMQSLTSDEE